MLREARIRELEAARAANHAAGLELPNINREPPAPAERPLPTDVVRFLDGFADPDARAEYAAEARLMLEHEPQLLPDAVIARLMAPVG